MKTFEQFIVESEQFTYKSPNKRPVGKMSKHDEVGLASKSSLHKETTYRGWKITPSIHASSRAHQRRPEFSFHDWKHIHRNVVHSLEKEPVKTGYHMVYSHSKSQGYVAHINPKKKQISIVTTLPKGKSHPGREGTGSMYVEEFLFSFDTVIFVD